MKVDDLRHSTRFHLLLLAGMLAIAAGLSSAQAAQAGPPAPDVPDGIAVPAGNKVFLVGHAVGVQIYSCNRPLAVLPGHPQRRGQISTTTTAS